VKSPAAVSALVPEDVVARTLTVPLPTGLVAVHFVTEAQLTFVPALAPNFIVVAPTTKFDPVIATAVPPVLEPVAGLIDVTTGVRYVKSSEGVFTLVPDVVVITTLTIPLPEGLVAMH
jgi:hypothetical protein